MNNNQIVLLLWQDMPGGIELLMPERIKNMPKFTFTAFVFRKNRDNASVFKNSNIPVLYGSSNNFVLYLKFLYFVFRNQEKIFHGFNIGPVMLFLLQLAGARNIIYSIHGTKYWKTKLQKLYLKFFWLISIREKIIFTSNSLWSREVFFREVTALTKIQTIYNPINPERFNTKTKNNQSSKKIIYSGRLTPGKNLFKWLECAKSISSTFPDATFSLYGDGPLKQRLINYSITLGISDKVIFHGFEKNIENAYQQADLLLFLSKYESFGNVVVESIFSGTPVIASDIPSMKEIFENFPEFLTLLDNNLENNVIEKIQNLPELKKSAGRAAKKFQTRFSLSRHIQQLETIYRGFK